MLQKKLLLLVLIFISLSTFAQSDAIWEKAVNAWESSKTIKADYCVKSIVASAKGFSSDYNTAGGVMEGGMIYSDTGMFKINVVRFVNKGEEYLLEGKPSAASYVDLMHTKENLLFAKDNQEFITINRINKDNSETAEYEITAKIPDYPEFQANAFVDISTGNPTKVINAKFASSQTTAAESKMTIIYKIENDYLVVDEKLEEVRVEFFGNASYISDSFVFSKYK